MQLSIVHFSDIHFKEDNNWLDNKTSYLVESIRSETLTSDIIVLVITGDIAFSGRDKEYYYAMDFLIHIQNEFPNIKFALVPGNHDIDFDHSHNGIRDILVQNIIEKKSQNTIGNSVFEQCCDSQSNYIEFHDSVLGNEAIFFADENKLLFKTGHYSENEISIHIHCINSAWLSQKSENVGKLLFPIGMIQKSENKADFAVTIMHHPFNWFDESNAKELQKKLEGISDLILTGHEHHAEKFSKDNLDGDNTIYIQGAELQSTSDSEQSGFNLFHINLVSMEFEVQFYSWNDGIYELENGTSKKIYSRKSSVRQNDFQFKKEHQEWLIENDINFTHPNKENISIEDYYIFPELEKVSLRSFEKAKVKREIINSGTLLSLGSLNHTIIYGNEMVGKTALCKRLSVRFLEQGYIPILLNGQKIRTSDSSNFLKLIKKMFLDQYIIKNTNIYGQINNSKKVVIIDNFHLCKLNEINKLKLIEFITKTFPNVLIVADDSMQFSEIFNKSKHLLFADFNHYEILEFGYSQRYKLIKKWNRININESISTEELNRKDIKCRSIINELIGKNWMPSTPFYLLILLQLQEAGEENLTEDHSNGKYYEFLIKKSFVTAGVSKKDFQALDSYLTELAFYYYTNEIKECNRAQLDKFHSAFLEKYDLAEETISFSNELLNANILHSDGHSYYFRYPYVYYFYVAKYFSKNLGDATIQSEIKRICSHLYMPIYANIIMFMTHNDNNKVVIEEVLNTTRNLFEATPEASFKGDIEKIDSLASNIPELILSDRSVDDVTEERQEALDNGHQNIEELKDSSTDEWIKNDKPFLNDLSTLMKPSQIIMAFKLLELIGQIMKSNYASLDGPTKLQLCEEAYSLTLRTLREFYQDLNECQDVLIEVVLDLLSEENKEKDDIEAVRQAARNVVFGMAANISKAIIKKSSINLGSIDIQKTLSKALANNSSSVAKMLDISIKFEHFKTLPFKEIGIFKKEIDGSILPSFLLKILTIEHLYKYERSYQEKDKLCEIVGLSNITQTKVLLNKKSLISKTANKHPPP